MLIALVLSLIAVTVVANALLRRGRPAAPPAAGLRDSDAMHTMAIVGSLQQFRTHPRRGFDMAKYTRDFGGE